MSDLINRQAAIDAIHNFEPDVMEYYYYKHYAEKVIESLPSAEQKQGKWVEISNGIGKYKCDQCGAERFTRDKYCSSCGARMERL